MVLIVYVAAFCRRVGTLVGPARCKRAALGHWRFDSVPADKAQQYDIVDDGGAPELESVGQTVNLLPQG